MHLAIRSTAARLSGSHTFSARCITTLLTATLLVVAGCGSLSRTGTTGPTWGAEAPSGRNEDTQAPAAPQDQKAQEQTPNVKARVYEAMARRSKAEAAGDMQGVEAALDDAMADVRILFQSDEAMRDAEVRELYRSVVTAYEQYYGVSDTLTVEYGDIFAVREEMFATMNAVREPLLEDVMMPELKPVTSTVPLTTNQLVEQSIRFLTREPDRHLNKWRSRSATYFPMIEKILREEGIPDEIKYLAMVESALNPRARSRAGAVGLWQFMPATGRAYGLHVDHWVDERSDPEKSTRAAARYLTDLYHQFGDWQLAIAAYNAGPGRVARAVRGQGGQRDDATFWSVYRSLPRETRNYVPMFTATALLLTNPDAFELPDVPPGPRYTYEVVAIEGSIDLRRAAELAGTDVATLRALNPEIRQWATPPARSKYYLRVPAGKGDRFTAGYAALPADERSGQTEYRVRSGDTLTRIARRYGTTVAALRAMNGIQGSLIRQGQLLYVPVQYDTYTGATAEAGTALVAYDTAPPVRNVSAPVQPARAVPEAAPPANTRVNYRVRRGDNLSTIATKYGVRVTDLKEWNDLDSDRIHPGQMLELYQGRRAAPAPAGDKRTYRVKRGDSLSRIAARHGVSVGDLRSWNDIRGDRIRIGQRLTLYGGRQVSSSRRGWVAYHVKRGDNLTAIAQRHHATVAELRKWNALRTDRLQVGQKLAIYIR